MSAGKSIGGGFMGGDMGLKPLRKGRTSKLEADLEWQLKAWEIPYEREFQFAAPRKWRFDFVVGYPRLIAIECDGATHYGNHLGRHQTTKGMNNDREKDAEALIRNWRVLHVTHDQIKSGQAIEWIRKLLSMEMV